MPGSNAANKWTVINQKPAPATQPVQALGMLDSTAITANSGSSRKGTGRHRANQSVMQKT